MTILVMALQDFDARAQDDIARLDARTLIGAFTWFFDGLSAQARAQGRFVEQWKAEKSLRGPGEPDD